MLDQHVQQAGFDISKFIIIPFTQIIDVNKWDLIFDFTKDESGKKLNYQFLDPSEFKFIEKTIDDIEGEPVKVFPYPQRYGGNVPDDINLQYEKKDDNMHSFSIHISAQDAQKVVEQVEEKQEQQ